MYGPWFYKIHNGDRKYLDIKLIIKPFMSNDRVSDFEVTRRSRSKALSFG